MAQGGQLPESFMEDSGPGYFLKPKIPPLVLLANAGLH
jgi:hypothetical protein